MLKNTQEQEPIVLTGSEEDLLRGVLGEILSGMGDYSGSILDEVHDLYERLEG